MMMMMADNNPKYSWDIPPSVDQQDDDDDDDDDINRRRLEIMNRLIISEDPRFYGTFKVINKETKDIVFRVEKSPYSSLVSFVTSIDENDSDNSPRLLPSSVWIDIDRMMLDCLIWVNPWFLAIDGKPVDKIEYKNKSVEIYQTQKTNPNCSWGPCVLSANGDVVYRFPNCSGNNRFIINHTTQEQFARHYFITHLNDFVPLARNTVRDIVSSIANLSGPVFQQTDYDLVIDWVLRELLTSGRIKSVQWALDQIHYKTVSQQFHPGLDF